MSETREMKAGERSLLGVLAGLLGIVLLGGILFLLLDLAGRQRPIDNGDLGAVMVMLGTAGLLFRLMHVQALKRIQRLEEEVAALRRRNT